MNNNRGEQLSFYQLFAEKEWNIEIPILQRDYAHGRDSAKEIREEFLDNLNEHLKDNKHIDLDFIYGSIEGLNNNTLILLDGQQRITTLFLLHWYLSNKENKNEKFKEFMVSEENGRKTSNFTYETRTSSREFCDALVKSDIRLDDLIGDSISETIQDKPWYFRSWGQDPTINSMLNMLDDMHEKFKNSERLFHKLLNTEEPIITFQFLNLEEFQLTDDLYIKMNARGKQLTPFENFKAKLEQYIQDELNLKTFDYKFSSKKDKQEITAEKYFSHKMDTDWTNLYWDYRNTNYEDDSSDDELMNYIRVVFTNQYIIDNSNLEKGGDIELLLDTKLAKNGEDDTESISFHKYKEMGVINKNAVLHLINAFDYMSDNKNNIKSIFDKDYFYYKEDDIFEDVLKHNLENDERIKFFASLRFLIKNNGKEFGIKEWMRVMHNLISHKRFNNSKDVANAINSIEEIMDYSDNILDYLTNFKNEINGFYSRQVQEERIKAYLIKKSTEWERIIKNAEQDEYYEGQIGFLLKFSGILDYYEQNNDCDWSLNKDKEFMNKFKEYSEKAQIVSPILNKEEDFNFLWERAVLTKGDYLIRHTAHRRNLLSTKSNMRDFSWKRLLRLPPVDANKKEKNKWKQKRKYVKEVFDDPVFSSKYVRISLEKICNDYSGNDWRKHFIKTPKIIRVCNQGYISFDDNKIYLFKESQRNHYHKELYSYLFYLNYLSDRKDGLKPFEEIRYDSVKSRNDDACAVLEDWHFEKNNYAIDIRYLPDPEKYEIRFFNRNRDYIHGEIKDILLNKNFQLTDKYEDRSYIITLDDEIKTFNYLKSFCTEVM